MTVKVKKKYAKINSKKYFRGKADDADLGYVGEKKNPLTKPPYFVPSSQVPERLFKADIKIGSPVELSIDSKTSSTELEVNGCVWVYKADTYKPEQMSYSAVRSADLVVRSLSLPESELIRDLNAITADTEKEYLKGEGNDGRIVSEVWIIMEKELSDLVTSGKAQIKVELDPGDVAGNVIDQARKRVLEQRIALLKEQIESLQVEIANITQELQTNPGPVRKRALEAQLERKEASLIDKRAELLEKQAELNALVQSEGGIILLENATTFAYALSKVNKWTKKRLKKDDVKDLKLDYKGIA